jgi:hypothetical protein
MNDKSIAISIVLSGPIDQVSAIIYFSDYFRTNFQKNINELNYSILDKSKINWKLINRHGRFTENRLKKFQHEIRSNTLQQVTGFELLKNFEKFEYKSIDIDLSITYQDERLFGFLNFILSSAWARHMDFNNIIKNINKFIKQQKGRIEYGCVLELSNKKLPSFYLQGILTENLDEEEKERIIKWSEQRTQANNKMWDIFWGNIISDNHIKGIAAASIDLKKLGWHVDKLDDNIIWFNSEKTIDSFDQKRDKSRKTLYKMLERVSLTM